MTGGKATTADSDTKSSALRRAVLDEAGAGQVRISLLRDGLQQLTAVLVRESGF